MIRLYIALFILSTMGAVAYAGKYYYDTTQATIATLRENNVKLKGAAETLQNTVDTLAADAERNAELNRNLTLRLQESSEYINRLRGRFAQIDLTMEALTDAEGLEERVNNAVKRLIDSIAKDTSPVDTTSDSPDGVSEPTTGD